MLIDGSQPPSQIVSLRVKKSFSRFTPTISGRAQQSQEIRDPDLAQQGPIQLEPSFFAIPTAEPSASAQNDPASSVKISIPTGVKQTSRRPEPKHASVDEEEMNPMNITDIPISAFTKNSRKGKRMLKLPPPVQSTIQRSKPKYHQLAANREPAASGPRVHVVDGRMIVDEESLIVRHPSGAENSEPLLVVHETGQRVTSSSFSTNAAREKRMRWTSHDTALFYEALSVCGTNFSLVHELFGGRISHRQIKNKFLAEEKSSPLKIDAFLKARRPLTVSFLSKFKSASEIEAYQKEDV